LKTQSPAKPPNQLTSFNESKLGGPRMRANPTLDYNPVRLEHSGERGFSAPDHMHAEKYGNNVQYFDVDVKERQIKTFESHVMPQTGGQPSSIRTRDHMTWKGDLDVNKPLPDHVHASSYGGKVNHYDTVTKERSNPTFENTPFDAQINHTHFYKEASERVRVTNSSESSVFAPSRKGNINDSVIFPPNDQQGNNIPPGAAGIRTNRVRDTPTWMDHNPTVTPSERPQSRGIRCGIRTADELGNTFCGYSTSGAHQYGKN